MGSFMPGSIHGTHGAGHGLNQGAHVGSLLSQSPGQGFPHISMRPQWASPASPSAHPGSQPALGQPGNSRSTSSPARAVRHGSSLPFSFKLYLLGSPWGLAVFLLLVGRRASPHDALFLTQCQSAEDVLPLCSRLPWLCPLLVLSSLLQVIGLGAILFLVCAGAHLPGFPQTGSSLEGKQQQQPGMWPTRIAGGSASGTGQWRPWGFLRVPSLPSGWALPRREHPVGVALKALWQQGEAAGGKGADRPSSVSRNTGPMSGFRPLLFPAPHTALRRGLLGVVSNPASPLLHLLRGKVPSPVASMFCSCLCCSTCPRHTCHPAVWKCSCCTLRIA